MKSIHDISIEQFPACKWNQLNNFSVNPKTRQKLKIIPYQQNFWSWNFPYPKLITFVWKKTLNISQKFFKILKISQNSLKNFSSQTSYYHFSYQFFTFLIEISHIRLKKSLNISQKPAFTFYSKFLLCFFFNRFEQIGSCYTYPRLAAEKILPKYQHELK